MSDPVSTKSNLVKLTIDGNPVEVPRGTLLIEAARISGIEIPYFCYHGKLKSDGNCRMCLVMIEKMPKLQVSCSVPVNEGMVVYTNNEVVAEARKGVLDFILANHPLDCPICDEGGRCPLQNYSQKFTAYGAFGEQKRVYEKDYFSPLIEKEMNRCVQCMRCVRYCDEVIDAKALAPVNRGSEVEIEHYAGKQLDCEFCGGCVQICPVGAILNRVALYEFRPWMLERTETTCAYCADGCSLRLETRQETKKIIEVTSFWGNEPRELWENTRNQGDLCAKGYFGYSFVNSPERLTKPLVRKDGKLVESSWEEAIEFAAGGLGRIHERDGGKAIAGVASARCTNENLFVFQKFLREGLGSPNLDSTPRYGMANAALAMSEMTGTARWLTSYEEISGAELIFVIGTDLTHTNPIAALKVKAAAKRGAKLIVATPLRKRISTISNIVNLATRRLGHRPGGERAVAALMVKALVETGGLSPDFQKTPLFKPLRQAAESLDEQTLAAEAGLDYSEIRAAAEEWSKASRSVILVGEAVLRSPDGYETLRVLGDLAAGTGRLAAEGCGLAPLYEENNELGAWEMGVVPDHLPGGKALETGKGLTLTGILRGARDGGIKGLYFMGENPVGTLPASAKAAEAVSAAEFKVCQDLFLTDTARLCDVVFPAASFAEQDGTFTNQEGFVQPVRRAFDPIKGARPDWEIISDLALAMGLSFEYEDEAAIGKEIQSAWPGWMDRPARDSAAASLAAFLSGDIGARYRFPEAKTKKPGKGEVELIMGPSLFHSGKMSLQSPGLLLTEGKGSLFLSPEDAGRIGVEEGKPVKIKSPAGEAEVPVRIDARFPEGLAFFPETFSAPAVRDLFDVEVAGAQQVPVFRSRVVSIRRI